MTDKIEETLDLAPLHESKLPAVYEEPEENPIEIAKTAYEDLIDKSNEALEEMLDIAKQSQDHRAFGTLSKMIKTIAELHTGLLDIQQPKAKPGAAPTEQQQAPVQNNTQNFFVGTTAELAMLIENAKNEQLPKAE